MPLLEAESPPLLPGNLSGRSERLLVHCVQHDLLRHSMRTACATLECCCRADAQAVFRRYWEYAYPIREFLAGTSEEAIQVIYPDCLLNRRGRPQDCSLDPHAESLTHCTADVASMLCSLEP